jgi:hypothetical protein
MGGGIGIFGVYQVHQGTEGVWEMMILGRIYMT